MDELNHRKNTIAHYQERGDAMRLELMKRTKAELVEMVLHYRFRSELANSEHREGEVIIEGKTSVLQKLRRDARRNKRTLDKSS